MLSTEPVWHLGGSVGVQPIVCLSTGLVRHRLMGECINQWMDHSTGMVTGPQAATMLGPLGIITVIMINLGGPGPAQYGQRAMIKSSTATPLLPGIVYRPLAVLIQTTMADHDSTKEGNRLWE